MSYSILNVAPASIIGDEQLGSKIKFWFCLGDERWLFKEAREKTGEDWAEKVASEIAARVGIDAARVELASFRSRAGSASLSFVHKGGETLVHGNEVLAGTILGYDREKRLHQSDHTLPNIVKAIRCLSQDDDEFQHGVLKKLASYLVLDALIGNTDRHHENWGMLQYTGRDLPLPRIQLKVAPSFDHASSLGRECSDARREKILRQYGIEWYVRRGRGGIFNEGGSGRGANPLDLVELSAHEFPQYFESSLQAICETPLDDLIKIIYEVPDSRITELGRRFAGEFVRYTKAMLERILS
jgi:hypothetical protein